MEHILDAAGERCAIVELVLAQQPGAKQGLLENRRLDLDGQTDKAFALARAVAT